ncbi:hypothetical protein COO60DRAFT_1636862 [Scenedesmus sp. NREL 46B-D3]|nr:hypothetical protein COO60DRAFT_1636862 [Scenedesmus sp. NREL 46B-D3]
MASTADEKASTHKNLGAALVQLAGLSSTTAGKRQQLLQSVHHKCQAYVEGPQAHKSEAWLETAREAIATSISLLTEQLSVLLQTAPANMGQVLQQLAELHAAVPEVIYEWRLYSSRDLLGAVRDAAARLIGPPSAAAAEGSRGTWAGAGDGSAAAEADCKGCLRLLAEANRPLIEALQALVLVMFAMLFLAMQTLAVLGQLEMQMLAVLGQLAMQTLAVLGRLVMQGLAVLRQLAMQTLVVMEQLAVTVTPVYFLQDVQKAPYTAANV